MEQTPAIVELNERVTAVCPTCSETVFGAQGRGFCKECMITFPLPKPSRKEVLSVFLLKYYLSKNSAHYHRPGCKYLHNISPENLIETTEPVGKPCRCVR